MSPVVRDETGGTRTGYAHQLNGNQVDGLTELCSETQGAEKAPYVSLRKLPVGWLSLKPAFSSRSRTIVNRWYSLSVIGPE